MIEGSKSGATGRLRIGMVGGGQGAFIGAVHRLVAAIAGRYDLVAGALSSDPERARASAAELGLDPSRSYDSYAAMAKAEAARDDGIDAVVIVTPNHVHAPAAKAFLEAGIDVICDKPLTSTLADAEDLVAAVERSGVTFSLTHNYTGYPLVRQARDMVAGGELGKLRVVQAEYAQDWLSTLQEATGNKQAEWRTDPARSGAGGCIGDIGTHAYNLGRFVTGLEATELCASLTTFVEGRKIDDDVQILLRYDGGARGMLWSSQVAAGNENNLRLRVYGEKAGLEWHQEEPNRLLFTPLGEQPRILTRGGAGLSDASTRATRIPPGHPEGYLEAFANLYVDAAELITARREGRAPAPEATLVPDAAEGLAGMRFIDAAVTSSQAGSVWQAVAR